MSGPPPLSRRDLLRAGTVGAGAALAGCVGGSSASFEPWTPAEGTWPLARYGPGNSGHNPNATPPREGVEPAWQKETEVSARGLVVAHDLVVAHGPDGMVVVSRSDSDYEWREPLPTQVAGFGPQDEAGRLPLYTAGSIGQRDGIAMGLARGWTYRPDTDSNRSASFWQTYEIGSSDEPRGVVTSADTLYVGHGTDGSLVAFDAGDGSTRWRTDGSSPALGDGRLVASSFPTSWGYEDRDGLDAQLNDGPATTWRGDGGLDPRAALVGGRAFVGRAVPFSDDPTLHGYDARTGETLWEPRRLGDSARPPAVVGDTGFVGASTFEDGEGDHGLAAGVLVALDLGDGTELWRDETDWWQHPAVAGGNGVVIAYGGQREGEERGRIRAYDADAGEELWTHATPSPVDSVALVRETVYASSRDGSVFALRAA